MEYLFKILLKHFIINKYQVCSVYTSITHVSFQSICLNHLYLYAENIPEKNRMEFYS